MKEYENYQPAEQTGSDETLPQSDRQHAQGPQAPLYGRDHQSAFPPPDRVTYAAAGNAAAGKEHRLAFPVASNPLLVPPEAENSFYNQFLNPHYVQRSIHPHPCFAAGQSAESAGAPYSYFSPADSAEWGGVVAAGMPFAMTQIATAAGAGLTDSLTDRCVTEMLACSADRGPAGWEITAFNRFSTEPETDLLWQEPAIHALPAGEVNQDRHDRSDNATVLAPPQFLSRNIVNISDSILAAPNTCSSAPAKTTLTPSALETISKGTQGTMIMVSSGTHMKPVVNFTIPDQVQMMHETTLRKSPQTATTGKRYRCGKCQKGFSNRSDLQKHTYVHTGEKPYKCGTCEKTYLSRQELTIHTRTHTVEKPYKCNICEKSYFHRWNLTIHTRTHTGEKPYKCNRCEKSYLHSWNLTIHIRTHTGERPYKCVTCEKSFSRESSLILHTRLHTGEKLYKCDMCEKSFSRKASLTLHTRTHTGEKPYKCNICEKSFSYKHVLTIHTRTHIGEKPSQSKLCEKSFIDLFNLNSPMCIHSLYAPLSSSNGARPESVLAALGGETAEPGSNGGAMHAWERTPQEDQGDFAALASGAQQPAEIMHLSGMNAPVPGGISSGEFGIIPLSLTEGARPESVLAALDGETAEPGSNGGAMHVWEQTPQGEKGDFAALASGAQQPAEIMHLSGMNAPVPGGIPSGEFGIIPFIDKYYTSKVYINSFSGGYCQVIPAGSRIEERPCVCKECGKSFETQVALKKHRQIH